MIDEEDLTPPSEEVENGSQGQIETPAEPELVPIERYKNAQARMTQATQEAAQLRRELEALRQQAIAPPQRQIPNEDEEDLSKWMQEYPDFAGPIVKKLNKQQAILKQLEEQNAQLRAQNETVQRDSFKQVVSAVHPDVGDIVNSDDFHGWLARQPKGISQMAHNGSADDVIYVLNQYKGSINAPRTSSKLDEARRVATPNVRNASTGASNATGQLKSFTREQIAAMSEKEFEANEEAIDAAMAAGLVT